ncbi:MAG: phosphotransferase [Oscillospiraceae bacterium]|nr:phosphotransferase [Oscillospiraceae bacterium]
MESIKICELELLNLVNQNYDIKGQSFHLHRDGSGRVYYVDCVDTRKVLKLYRSIETEAAIQSTHILQYLCNCEFPVVKIIPAVSGDMYITATTPEGECVLILFEFAKGKCIEFLHRWRDNKQPLIHPKAKMLGRQVGLMHRLMENYDGPIILKGRERYIDDLIMLIRRDGYDKAKIKDIEEYGNELWTMVEKLPKGFCHGDMHTGNTVYYNKQFTWMDFDRAAISYPVIDVGWLTDATDFNVFDDGAFDRSRKLFNVLYEGYSMERQMTKEEISAVFGCTAIIHFDLISSILIRNNETLSKELFDEQHDWLMRWRELCAKKM